MYTMKQTCEITGLTYETLKFYCNKGIVPNVERNANNHRIFNEDNIRWLKNLSCLRDCGLSIHEMVEYVELAVAGQNTIPARREILNLKQQEVKNKIKRLEQSLRYIELKQEFYNDVEEGNISYYSYIDVDSIKE
ncbi:MAG: MerR family transcriptional regulator [Bacilli bacterium]